MSFDNIAGLAAALLTVGYLVAALIAPERFQ